MKSADISKITIKPDYMESAYGTSSVAVTPIHSYQVYLGTRDDVPSFTLFVKDSGKIESVEDVLESGDTDFFPSVGNLAAFYFDLIKEIKKPGSSNRPGKMLALYTARPTKDRRLYEKGRKVPVSIFLTSDMNRAAGIAHDLGSNEVRDIWFVRINEQHLVQTLNAPYAKDYQVVGSGRFVPVKSLDLVWEGGSKHGSKTATSRALQQHLIDPTSQKAAKYQDFFISDDGDVYWVDDGAHFEVEDAARQALKLPENIDIVDDKGWIKIQGAIANKKRPIRLIYNVRKPFTQRQIDALWNLALTYKEHDPRNGENSFQVLNQAIKATGKKLASAEHLDIPSGFLEGSVFKDIAYKGSNLQVTEGFSLSPKGGSEYGIYLTPNHRYARRYGRNLIKTLVNIKRPLVVEGKHEISPKDLTKQDIAQLKHQGYDGIISTTSTFEKATEIVAFDSKQVWVMDTGRQASTPTVVLLQGATKQQFLQQHKLRKGNIEVFGVVSSDNTVLGGVAVRKSVGKYAKNIYASQGIVPDVTISQLYVDPTHRSKGLGKLLLNTVLQKYKSVALGTDNKKVHTNAEAVLLYQHAGFRPVQRERNSTFWIREG